MAGNWTEWTAWSTCSASCGTDVNRTRTRACDNPAPQHDGSECLRLNNTYGMNDDDYQSCNLTCCPGIEAIWILF